MCLPVCVCDTFPVKMQQLLFLFLTRWEHTLEDVTRTVLLTRALPLAMYTFLTTVQRYHLFVWTVFSPKLLYEGMLTVVMVALVLLLELARQMR